VLPRAQLFYTRLDLAEVPPRQRREAALLELEQQAPFEQPRGWALWQGSRACIWYWSGDLEHRLLPGEGAEQAPIVPETALWPPLPEDHWRWLEDPDTGLYLLQYQHPHQGLYERRFGGPVAAQEAHAWLKRHGADLTEEQRAALAPQRPPEPRAPQGQSLMPMDSAVEQRLLPGLAIFLVFLCLVYALAWARADWAAHQARTRHQAMEEQVQDRVAQERQARRLSAENRQLGSLREPSQLLLAAYIAQQLALQNTQLVRWQYRDQRLELSWQAEGSLPEATQIIRRLEASPALSRVQAQTRGDTLELSLVVTPAELARWEPPGPEAGANPGQAAPNPSSGAEQAQDRQEGEDV